LRVGLARGPGVLWKSRALSRISTYALAVKCGRARSNELRGTMFTAPASAAPVMSGVGENETSTRARLLIEIMSSAALRPVPPPGCAEARLKPSTVIGT
jgi:hypothetical protein